MLSDQTDGEIGRDKGTGETGKCRHAKDRLRQSGPFTQCNKPRIGFQRCRQSRPGLQKAKYKGQYKSNLSNFRKHGASSTTNVAYLARLQDETSVSNWSRSAANRKVPAP